MPKHAKSDFGDKMIDTYEKVKDFVKELSTPKGEAKPTIDPQVGEQACGDLDKLREKYKGW